MRMSAVFKGLAGGGDRQRRQAQQNQQLGLAAGQILPTVGVRFGARWGALPNAHTWTEYADECRVDSDGTLSYEGVSCSSRCLLST